MRRPWFSLAVSAPTDTRAAVIVGVSFPTLSGSELRVLSKTRSARSKPMGEAISKAENTRPLGTAGEQASRMFLGAGSPGWRIGKLALYVRSRLARPAPSTGSWSNANPLPVTATSGASSRGSGPSRSGVSTPSWAAVSFGDRAASFATLLRQPTIPSATPIAGSRTAARDKDVRV